VPYTLSDWSILFDAAGASGHHGVDESLPGACILNLARTRGVVKALNGSNQVEPGACSTPEESNNNNRIRIEHSLKLLLLLLRSLVERFVYHCS
jgi:hypothetical protein